MILRSAPAPFYVPKSHSRVHLLTRIGPPPLTDVSADPALRWDTLSHPLASRAEPPNSAQPFLFQVLGPMKCLN